MILSNIPRISIPKIDIYNLENTCVFNLPNFDSIVLVFLFFKKRSGA